MPSHMSLFAYGFVSIRLVPWYWYLCLSSSKPHGSGRENQKEDKNESAAFGKDPSGRQV